MAPKVKRKVSTADSTGLPARISAVFLLITIFLAESVVAQVPLCSWAPWQDCSESCGGGYRIRERTLTTACSVCVPANLTNTGIIETQVVSCNTSPCPQDCETTEWSCWSGCNQPCKIQGENPPQREQRRTITQQPLRGAACPILSMMENCNDHECPSDCSYDNWQNWGTCSQTCDGGARTRTRGVTVVYDVRRPGTSQSCPVTEDTQVCGAAACPIDCQLSDWGKWSECPECGEDAKRVRFRQITRYPQNGGKDCAEADPLNKGGDLVDEEKCDDTYDCDVERLKYECKWYQDYQIKYLTHEECPKAYVICFGDGSSGKIAVCDDDERFSTRRWDCVDEDDCGDYEDYDYEYGWYGDYYDDRYRQGYRVGDYGDDYYRRDRRRYDYDRYDDDDHDDEDDDDYEEERKYKRKYKKIQHKYYPKYRNRFPAGRRAYRPPTAAPYYPVPVLKPGYPSSNPSVDQSFCLWLSDGPYEACPCCNYFYICRNKQPILKYCTADPVWEDLVYEAEWKKCMPRNQVPACRGYGRPAPARPSYAYGSSSSGPPYGPASGGGGYGYGRPANRPSYGPPGYGYGRPRGPASGGGGYGYGPSGNRPSYGLSSGGLGYGYGRPPSAPSKPYPAPSRPQASGGYYSPRPAAPSIPKGPAAAVSYKPVILPQNPKVAILSGGISPKFGGAAPKRTKPGYG